MPSVFTIQPLTISIVHSKWTKQLLFLVEFGNFWIFFFVVDVVVVCVIFFFGAVRRGGSTGTQPIGVATGHPNGRKRAHSTLPRRMISVHIVCCVIVFRPIAKMV